MVHRLVLCREPSGKMCSSETGPRSPHHRFLPVGTLYHQLRLYKFAAAISVLLDLTTETDKESTSLVRTMDFQSWNSSHLWMVKHRPTEKKEGNYQSDIEMAGKYLLYDILSIWVLHIMAFSLVS